MVVHLVANQGTRVRFPSPTPLQYIQCKRGDVTEWLGRGLQNLVRRFESARRLHLAQKDKKVEIEIRENEKW